METTLLSGKAAAAVRQYTDKSATHDVENFTPANTTTGGNLNEECQDLPVLRHKVDRRIVPVMFLCHLMQLIDKVALNVGDAMSCLLRSRS